MNFAGWGWFLWFSSVGNWSYTYRAHSRFNELSRNKNSIDTLNERYARGELSHEEYARMKSAILDEPNSDLKKTA
jgi:putative membrane protein